MAWISRFAAAILSGETELALGTIRVKVSVLGAYCLHIKRNWDRVMLIIEIAIYIARIL